MAAVTAWTLWPDIVLGAAIVVINGAAAKEVWELAEEERLAAKALAGEEVDQCRRWCTRGTEPSRG